MSAAHRDRRFVISGAASGIGLATARLALQRGGRVCLLDCDHGRLSDVARELGSRAFPAECDVTDAGAVASVIEDAAGRLGGIDAVVSSAGADLCVSLELMDEAGWARTLATNLTGPMLLCRAALPHLRSAGGGTIVNVSSAAGLSPLMHRTAYCAAKAGLIMFGKALAMEVAADRIRVNAVCPGAVDTPMFRTSYEAADDPERELEAIRRRYAMHRVAAPEEVAEAILYLSGAGSSYITGAALAVDGGRSYH